MPTTAQVAARPRQRWVMWTIPALLFLVGFFHRAAPGVMARDLMQAFDVTSAGIGSLAATYFYAYAALMIPAGLLLDAFGVRIVLAIGGAIMGGGALLMGAASGPTLLFAGRFLVGLGAANPPHLDGVAVAVVNFGGFLGAALTQGPLGAVLDAHWTGALADGVRRYPVEAYRTGFALCAALVAGAALLSLLMHETRDHNIYAERRGSPPGSRIGTEPA